VCKQHERTKSKAIILYIDCSSSKRIEERKGKKMHKYWEPKRSQFTDTDRESDQTKRPTT